MTATINKALALWGVTDAPWRLAAARENAVYQVQTPDGPRALRLHRKGYRSDAELRSELAWMAAVARGGLSVPAPCPARDGAMLHDVDGIQVDMLTWLDGAPLSAALPEMSAQKRLHIFGALGAAMARLHEICDRWTPPPGFQRVHWTQDGLLGETPLWGRFWENPSLTSDDAELFTTARMHAAADLQTRAPKLDTGLIHADLVPDNVMVHGAGDSVAMIDFDDGGFGFRLFDLATALLKHRDAPDYDALQNALIGGYQALRPIDPEAMPLFMFLRAATYVGWIVPRMSEPGAQRRNDVFIARLRSLAGGYLARST
ncbi:homoserine kinase [Roseobacteraceae bacterium S113]